MKYAMLSPVGAVQFPLMILHKLREIGCDAIGGLEMGAVPVISSTAAVGALYGQPVNAFFIRKEAKGHGTRERVEGTLIETLKDSAVAVVDDVTTTGGSAMTAVGVLRELQIDVRNVITIVDREEGASETFAAEGLALHALFRKSEFAHDLT